MLATTAERPAPHPPLLLLLPLPCLAFAFLSVIPSGNLLLPLPLPLFSGYHSQRSEKHTSPTTNAVISTGAQRSGETPVLAFALAFHPHWECAFAFAPATRNPSRHRRAQAPSYPKAGSPML